MPTITEQVIKAIGPDQPSDWKLDPKTEAGHLPAEAGALRRILNRDDLTELMTRFEVSDKAAIEAQAKYQAWSRNTFMCRFLAVAMGTLGLLKISGTVPTPGWLGAAGGGMQYALLAGALIFGLLLAQRHPFETWMAHRASAENARVDLFFRVTEAQEATKAGELPLLPLQLEYFRRYQLDVQRYYYRNRGLQHARAAGQSKYWRALLVALAAVSALLSVLVFLPGKSFLPLPTPVLQVAEFATNGIGEVMLLIAGIIAAALGNLMSALSLTRLDRRNAARYLSNADNLDFLRQKYLDEARQAALRGNGAAVRAFIALVQETISSEHREWIALREAAGELTLEHFADRRLPGRHINRTEPAI